MWTSLPAGRVAAVLSGALLLTVTETRGSQVEGEFAEGLRYVQGEALERSLAHVKRNLTDEGIEALMVQVMAVMAHAIRYDHRYDGHEKPLQPFALMKVAELVAEAKHIDRLRPLLRRLATDEKATPEERQAAVRIYVRHLLKHVEDARLEILALAGGDVARKDKLYTRHIVQGAVEEGASQTLLLVLAAKLRQWEELTSRDQETIARSEFEDLSEQIAWCAFPLAFRGGRMKVDLADARPAIGPCLRFVRWAGKVREEWGRPHSVQQAKEYLLAFLAERLDESEEANDRTAWRDRGGRQDAEGKQALGFSVAVSKQMLRVLVEEVDDAADDLVSGNVLCVVRNVLQSNGLLPADAQGGMRRGRRGPLR